MPFKIIRNDITKVHADAIVNTANPDPTYGAGTDAAIYRAAGEKKLLAERRKIGRLGAGEAVVTPAFNLKAKYIIHTVGPVWVDGKHREFELLASCYRKSLQIARHLHCRSIAFPLISTGTYGFPREKALNIALDQISSFLEEEEMDVTLVVFDRKTFELSSELRKDVGQYIDENYVENRLRKEYGGQYPGRRQGGAGQILQYLKSRRRADKSSQETSADIFSQEKSTDKSLQETSADKSSQETNADKSSQETSADIFSQEKSTDKSSQEISAYREQVPAPAMDTGEWEQVPVPVTDSGDLPDLFLEESPEEYSAIFPEPSGSGSDRELFSAEEPKDTYSEESKPEASYAEESKPRASYPEESKPEALHMPAGAGKHSSKKTILKEERRIESGSSVHRRSLQDVISHMGESFQECLLRMIDERGLTDAQVYKRANLDRKLFSKIRCNPNYNPSRRTVIALAIALELNMDEAVDLLRRAGMALSPGSKFDLIISYCIQNQIYDIYRVNALLFDYDQPLLGAV